MNVGVEISFFAALALWAAIARDIYIRRRVETSESIARQDREKSENIARQDRLEKERLDREQASDIAIITHVPAWMELDEKTEERELRRQFQEEKDNLAAEKEKNKELEAQNSELRRLLAPPASPPPKGKRL